MFGYSPEEYYKLTKKSRDKTDEIFVSKILLYVEQSLLKIYVVKTGISTKCAVVKYYCVLQYYSHGFWTPDVWYSTVATGEIGFLIKEVFSLLESLYVKQSV